MLSVPLTIEEKAMISPLVPFRTREDFETFVRNQEMMSLLRRHILDKLKGKPVETFVGNFFRLIFFRWVLLSYRWLKNE